MFHFSMTKINILDHNKCFLLLCFKIRIQPTVHFFFLKFLSHVRAGVKGLTRLTLKI